MKDYRQEYEELKWEFDKIYSKLYLSEQENKDLKRENKRLEKKINMLIEKVVDLSSARGVKPSI